VETEAGGRYRRYLANVPVVFNILPHHGLGMVQEDLNHAGHSHTFSLLCLILRQGHELGGGVKQVDSCGAGSLEVLLPLFDKHDQIRHLFETPLPFSSRDSFFDMMQFSGKGQGSHNGNGGRTTDLEVFVLSFILSFFHSFFLSFS